jgi:uncharacterized damage-inducible protein DinB
VPLSAKRLLVFSDQLNDRWFPELRSMDPELLTRDYKCSFYTPLAVLTHVGNVEKSWARLIAGETFAWDRPSKDRWTEPEPVIDHLQAVRAYTHEVVDDLDPEEMQRPRHLDVEIEGFEREALTPEEALFTIFTHEQWHRGELLSILWSQGVEPPPVDWPQYGAELTTDEAEPAAHP